MSCYVWQLNILYLHFSIEGDPVDFSVSPVAIFESLLTSPKIESQANFVLVVEKDSIFQKLLDEGYTATYPHSILVSVSLGPFVI